VKLFRSHRNGVADGDQRRDFIYVADVVSAIEWLLHAPATSGIFNLGTGTARSFRDVILAMFAALNQSPNIVYIDMPLAIRDSYQYFTEAPMANLRRAGYATEFTPLEPAVHNYVTSFLDRQDRFR
jgi:ADP-L-glycero-D-manno-heptose 6-epimerase